MSTLGLNLQSPVCELSLVSDEPRLQMVSMGRQSVGAVAALTARCIDAIRYKIVPLKLSAAAWEVAQRVGTSSHGVVEMALLQPT